MARNGSGTYSLPAGNPVVTGTPISSTTHNTTMTDIANAITQSIAYDGQTTPIANIPMGGNKLTGLAAATVNGDAVRYEQMVNPTVVASVNAGPLAGFRNRLTNGGFDIWQRGTSFANPSAAYTADRWYSTCTATTISRSVPFAGYGQYAASLTATNATNSAFLSQALRSNACESLKGKTVTFSFSYSASVNEPASSMTIAVQKNGTADTQTGGTWVTLAALSGATAYTPTTSAQVAQITVAVPADATANGLRVNIQTTNITNGSTVAIYDVQLEVGAVATPFEWHGDLELATCQKSYFKTFAQATAPAQNAGTTCAFLFPVFIAGAATNKTTELVFPVTMFATPTLVTYNPSAANAQPRNLDAAADCSAVAAYSSSSTRSATFSYTGSAGGTVGQIVALHVTAEAELV